MRKIRKTITKTPAIIVHGRAMHPVVRAAFKAVELLIKWLEGSTPSSSADINLNQVELFYCEDNLPYLSPVIVN